MTVLWTPETVARITAGIEPTYVGRHRAPSKRRTIAPLNRVMHPVELMVETTFVELRHLGLEPDLMGPWDDARSVGDAAALATIEASDWRLGNTLAVAS